MIKNFSSYDPNYPACNWGIKILSETESFESFVAKFCYLNQMNIKKFLRLWGEFNTDRKKLDIFLNKISANDTDRKILFSYITPIYNKYDCIEQKIIIKRGQDSHTNILFYCDECMKLGFHSKIFNKNWIVICPFHRVSLKKVELSTRSNINKIDFFSLRVKKITELAIKNNSSWPRIKNKFLGSSFCRIRDWLIGLEEENNKYHIITGNTISAVNEKNIKEILNFFNYIFLIPKEIIFLFPYLNENVYRVKIYDNDEILAFLKKFNGEINNIIEFYKNKLQKDKLNNFNFYNLINSFLEYIEIIHLKSNCKWAERKREYCWTTSRAQFHNNMWTVCQYEHVKHLINSNWLDYNLLKRNEIKKIINVEVSYQKIDISSVVADFFEDILFEILINTVSELNNRMNEIIEIQTRGKVDLREIFTSNIYLKLEDDKCILINTLGSFDTVTKLINFE